MVRFARRRAGQAPGLQLCRNRRVSVFLVLADYFFASEDNGPDILKAIQRGKSLRLAFFVFRLKGEGVRRFFNEGGVNFFDGVNHRVGGEFADDGVAGGGAEAGAQGGVGDEFIAGAGEMVDAFGLDQEAGLAVDDFFGAVDVEADDGLGAEHGLREDAGQAFAQ